MDKENKNYNKTFNETKTFKRFGIHLFFEISCTNLKKQKQIVD